MIYIKQISENPENFRAACRAKKFDVDIDRLLEIDSQIKTARQNLQNISTEKNRLGKSIPKLSPDEKQSALSQLAELKSQEAKYDKTISDFQPELDELMQ